MLRPKKANGCQIDFKLGHCHRNKLAIAIIQSVIRETHLIGIRVSKKVFNLNGRIMHVVIIMLLKVLKS